MANYKPKPGWRDEYNPLRGLTMSRIVSMEDAAERGDHADLQWLWRHMEQTDVTVQTAVATRLSYVRSLDWQIRTVDNADPMLAAEQQDVLRYAYDRLENLVDAATEIAKAIFTGFSILEKVRTGYGPLCRRLDPIPGRFWQYNKDEARWYFNPTAAPGGHQTDPVELADLVIHDHGNPLFKPICRHFFAKQLAMADWDVALENSANQAIFLVGPPGTTAEKDREYQALAEAITSNLRGYVPNGADIKVTDLGARTRLPFQERITYSDQQIVLSATGGKLSMLTERGSGTLAGGAHRDTLLELARADAAAVSEVLNDQFDKEILRAFFPKQPLVAYFRFDVPQKAESSKEVIEAAANLAWSGYKIEKAQLEEKLGLKLEIIAPPGT
jgi:phage gp29-like protein